MPIEVRPMFRLIGSDRFADGLRVLLALAGLLAFGQAGGRADLLIPLLLGVIAGALAETGEALPGRLGALLVTLACFSIAALGVKLLFDHPWAFALALGTASLGLVMLGAASPRYATIANATLLLAVYTMIGADQHAAGAPWWREPLLLVAGGAWYGLFSLAWSALSVQQPVHQSLARLYGAIGDYLTCKARLFVPEHGLDVDRLRLELAQANARVVDALNDTRLLLIDRLHGRRSRAAMAVALRRYLAAQDIHERAGATHHPYPALTEAFFHSDVLFRCQRLLLLLGDRCRELGRALASGHPAEADARAAAALDALRKSLDHLEDQGARGPHLSALQGLVTNVTALQDALAPRDGTVPADQAPLQDPSPRTPAEAWRRIRVQLTPASARFRHGLRLALAMVAGYAVLRVIHPQQGYWILLTTMLVCQPSYGATWRRLFERIAGTVAGLLAGWALLRLFPAPPVQLGLSAAACVLFFLLRYRRYTLATAAVTVLVLLVFNQIGNGYALILPRLVDTLIGAGLAALATLLVLPEGRERETRELLAAALRADAAYLRQAIGQYAEGKRDDLPYRIARRDAQNADAAVSTHLASVLREPGQRGTSAELALRLLVRTHALLGHLSALGAHRQRLPDPSVLAQVERHADALAAALENIAATLAGGTDGTDGTGDSGGAPAPLPGELPPSADPVARLVDMQLMQIAGELPGLRELAVRARA